MAQLILIDIGTLNPGKNILGDLVDIYDSGKIDPNSSGYKTFRVVELPQYTGEELKTYIGSQLSKTQFVSKHSVNFAALTNVDEENLLTMSKVQVTTLLGNRLVEKN